MYENANTSDHRLKLTFGKKSIFRAKLSKNIIVTKIGLLKRGWLFVMIKMIDMGNGLWSRFSCFILEHNNMNIQIQERRVGHSTMVYVNWLENVNVVPVLVFWFDANSGGNWKIFIDKVPHLDKIQKNSSIVSGERHLTAIISVFSLHAIVFNVFGWLCEGTSPTARLPQGGAFLG